MTFSDNEPALTSAAVITLVTALIGIGVAFGLPITTEQKEAILALAAVVAPIAVALLVRPHVTPVAHVNALVAEAAMAGLGDPVAKAALLQAEATK